MPTKIVVIDDEPLICRLLSYQLGDAGYSVMTFQRGQEALLHLAQDQPDLVLLDLMMPDMSGHDLCREIRAFSPVPIIMLTAKQGDDDVVAGLTVGADDYVAKPFSAAQLVARIEAVLRRARPGQPRVATQKSQLVPAVLAARTLRSPVPEPAPSNPPAPTLPALPRLGPRLAETRHQRGMSLHEAERACGVRWEFLQAIEHEQFSYVPRASLRAALRDYSAWLEIDLQPYLGVRVQRRPLRANLALAATFLLLIVLTAAVLML